MKITLEELVKNIETFKAGTKIELYGTIYTARDQAHKRMTEIINAGGKLPFELKNSCIYYCGPCPKSPQRVIGSCGPTTSSRMDVYTPQILDNGVKVIVGKGKRSADVVESLKKNKAIYLLATGGVGALFANKVKSCELVAFEELGPEAVYKLEAEGFPLTVGIDSYGNNLFEKR